MSAVPAIFGGGRARGVALVTASAVGQALAAGVAAFATRDIFYTLHHGEGQIAVLSLSLLLLAGLGVAVLRVYGRVWAEKLGQDYAIALRQALFRHLAYMPAGAVATRRTGALGLRFVGDLATARNWVGLGVARLIAAAVVLPAAAGVLLVMNPSLAVAALVPLAVSLALLGAVAYRLAPLHRELRKERANLAIDMMERVSVAPELLLMGRAGHELRNLNKRGGRLRTAAVRRIRGAAALKCVPEIGTAAAAAALLAMAFKTGAAPADAAAGLAVLGILVQPLRDLASVWDRRCAWLIARQKCETVLSTPPLEKAALGRVPEREGPARLAFRDVHKGALRRFSAELEPGTKVAVLGANGTGKSTCLALAAGLEQSEGGTVEIDGIDIRAFPHSERQRAVVYIGPRSPILQGSLRRALTLGVEPRPKDAKIEATARELGLGPLLERLGGLDARVSEAGRNISSGEAQCIHLVRASLGRPRLLLLDETDGVLDRIGREALRRLMRSSEATTLYVTHDPNLARSADVLWYLENGSIRDRGAPDELLRGDGPAARFFGLRSVA